MDRMLKLNDGSILENSYAIEASGRLWIYVYGETGMVELFRLLSNPGKTQKITGNQYGAETVWTGYTDLFYIRSEDDGSFSAGLRK